MTYFTRNVTTRLHRSDCMNIWWTCEWKAMAWQVLSSWLPRHCLLNDFLSTSWQLPAPTWDTQQSDITMNEYEYEYPFNGPLSRLPGWAGTRKENLDFTEARDRVWQWHQLGHMHVCTSLQTDNHASTPPLSFFTGWMPFLPPNQQRQSTEGK